MSRDSQITSSKPRSPLGRALAGFRGRIDAILVGDDKSGLPVRVDHATVALRRREAMAILVT